jgi:HEAT repeat protein
LIGLPPTSNKDSIMEALTLEELVENIRSDDDAVRAAARDNAGRVGAPAIGPLAEIAAEAKLEIARAAVRAMRNIVYHAGRPGAAAEAEAVAAELIRLISAEPPWQLRRDVLWMTWQIAGSAAVSKVAALLDHPELAEDARMCLEGLPVEEAVAALKAALDKAPDAGKPALGHSLRKRGVEVPGVPDLRLTPTRQTRVVPVGRDST